MAGLSTPHLLVSGTCGAYRPLASHWLDRELASGDQHPMLCVGFLGGDLDGVAATQTMVDGRIIEWVDQTDRNTSMVINRFGPSIPTS
ncbi:hypothetical protein [Streptomyces sp. NPDC058401]|uniref:hypothetical protein n=1 Tax=Streptomyces sp. NPDC058401 TaxID=3346480 RepID=UPI00366434D7